MSTMTSWERARRKSINNRELLIAISHNNFVEVDRIINEGADINYTDPDGYSALSLAVEYADSKVIRRLIDKGAILDSKINNRESPLEIAKRLNRFDIVEILEGTTDQNSLPLNSDVIPTILQNGVESTHNVIKNDKHDLWNDLFYDCIFRLKVLLLFLYRGVRCKYSFRLGTKIQGVRNFDDLVLELTEGDRKVYRILQAKHAIDETKRITADKLFSETNDDYSLLKYFELFLDCKRKTFFKVGSIKDITVCTNIDFDFDSLKEADVEVETVEEKDAISDIKSRKKKPTKYKFNHKIVPKLVKKLQKCKFKRKLEKSSVEVEHFVECLVFVVNQPNDDELGSIVKKEIGKELDFLSAEHVNNKFYSRMLDWTKHRSIFIPFNEGEEFFEDLKKDNFIRYNVQDPVKSFTGRLEQLETMHKLLQNDDNSLLCISGLSGVGKSELVKKYVADYAEFYDNRIVWINAESYQTLTGCFHKLASDKLDISTTNVDGKEKDTNLLVAEVYQQFSKSKSLFVFDNSKMYKSQSDFDDGIDRFLPRLPNNCHKPHIIVTSRSHEWPSDVKILDLKAFSQREAVEFVSKTLQLKNDEQKKQAEELGKRLRLLPLALQQAVAYIIAQYTESSFHITDYFVKLRDASREVDAQNDCDSGYNQTVLTTCNVALGAIKQQENGTDIANILNIVCYFLSDNIPVEILLIFQSDRNKLASAIEVLRQYSLVDVQHKCLNVHSLVQRMIRTKLVESDEEKSVLEEILKLIKPHHVNARNVDHFTSIWLYSKKYIELVEMYHSVFSMITGQLASCGRIEEAHFMGMEIVELLNRFSSNSTNVQIGLMSVKSRIGDILLRQGKYEAALREFEELYQTEIDLRGSNNNKTLDTKSDIALALQKLGRNDEALCCYEEVLKVRMNTLGESHPQTLSIKSQIATVLMEKGQYDEALPILEQVYESQLATLGSNHYDSLMTKNSMAALFLMQRKHEEALRIFQEIYDARNDMRVDNHPALLMSKHNIASAFQRQKKYDLALEIYQDVYKIQKEMLGQDHPEVLAVRGEVALMMQMLGEHDEALRILRDVLDKQSEVLGLYHPLVLRTQFFIANNLEEQCKYSEALPIYQELLKLGIAATGVASMPLKLHDSIGSIFMQQGNVDKALKHYTEVLNITENTLGPNHPRTLIAKSNVGSLHYKKKDYDKALSILTEVHDTEEIVFGKEHETYNSTYHFINKILFEKELYENQLRSIKQSPTDNPLVAIENGDLTSLKKLMKKVPNVNASDTNKKTLLHHATRMNRLEIVKYLLKNGADMTMVTEKGKTALHVAVLQNHLEIADELLRNISHDQLRNLIDAKTTMTGSTALHVAAKNGFYDVARLLLTRGATYDVKNNDGKLPVELAKNSNIIALLNETDTLFKLVRSGDKDCHEKLQQYPVLEYLAFTNARDYLGYSLMLVAVANNRRDLIKSLRDLSVVRSRHVCSLPVFNVNLDDVLPLTASVLTKLRDDTCTTKIALKHVRKLITTFRSHDKRILDPNVLMIEDLLMLLKSRKDDDTFADVVRIVVDGYVKMFEVSIHTAKLLEAAKRNDWASVRKFVSELGNVNVTDDGGWTPLLHAANAGNEQIVKLLLNNGAEVNCATNTGKNTSLHIAVNKGHLDIVKLLLERDTSSEFINARTEAKGSTAMHLAAKIGRFDIVVLLLINGAIYCLPNKDGQLPVDLASDDEMKNFFDLVDELFYDVKNGRVEIIGKLRELERDQFLAVISANNEEEMTLTNVAAMREHRDIAIKIAAMYKAFV